MSPNSLHLNYDDFRPNSRSMWTFDVVVCELVEMLIECVMTMRMMLDGRRH